MTKAETFFEDLTKEIPDVKKGNMFGAAGSICFRHSEHS